MAKTAKHKALLVGVVLLASGCAATDPYEKEGVWHPNGSNDSNLRAMVAIPSDLAQGVGDGRGNSQQAEAAIERLRQDRVRSLPATGIAEFNVGNSGTGSGGAAAIAPAGAQ